MPQWPAEAPSEEVGQKRRELAKAKLDNTGVWKGPYFGRDLKNLLEERNLEDGPEGKIAKTNEDQTTHFILVNMGELDRLNAGGDHTVGDNALKATADAIKKQLAGKVAEGDYDIYRTAGNDFSVKLKNTDVAVARQLALALSGKVDLSHIKQEAAPVEASLMSQSDLVDVLNGLEDGDRQAFMDEEDKAGESINIVKELLQQQNDIQKIEMRFRRMEEKLAEGDAAAEPFYKEFQSKVFSGALGVANLEYADFVKKLKEMGYGDPARADEYREAKHRLALKDARRQYQDRRGEASGVEKILVEEAAKKALSEAEATGSREGKTVPPEAQQEAAFTAPEDTRGKKLVAQKEAEYASSKTELAYLDLEIEKAKRDTLTGLAERGAMFGNLSEGLKNKEQMSLVFIDMAFLKYFDKEGGRETGNIAIKKAAELLDKLAAEVSTDGLKVEAYRIGGDEFALGILGGTPSKVAELQKLLVKKQLEAPPIPLQGKQAAGTYYKQKLSFNYGVFGPKNLDEAKAFMQEKGIKLHSEPGSDDEREEVVEFALKLSDKQLEIQKGVNRITLLTEELRAAKASGDSGKFDQLIKYSQKGIFGKKGEKLIRELAEKPSGDGVERVLRFVVDAIREKSSKREGYENSLDKIIDEKVKELYFDQQLEGMRDAIQQLQTELAAANTKNETLHAENQQLRMQIAELQQEVQSVAGLRQKILSA